MYVIEYAEGVADDLSTLRARQRRQTVDKIEEQLRHEPCKRTRNKKIVRGLKPPWEYEEPIWELRVGKFRVFYDVADDVRRVVVRAVREKPPHKTTEEIL